MKNPLNILIVPVLIITVLATVFFSYTGQYYHAEEAAQHAMTSDGSVEISRTAYGWLFDGPSDENAFIFYPGAKVEETAYAPLCRRLAEEGIDVCLVRMPFRLAFFGSEKAGEVMKGSAYDHWYIGGHSLGGAMAAMYAADHTDLIDGVILLASYSTKTLDDHLETILIYGSEDTVLNMDKYRECLENVPEDAAECVIDGGNHAQFGTYGVQKGDGTASIMPEQQVEKTVNFILENLFDSSAKIVNQPDDMLHSA